MADFGFLKSYIATYDNATGTITIDFESDPFDQAVNISYVGGQCGSLEFSIFMDSYSSW
jgi:hypothetical protein